MKASGIGHRSQQVERGSPRRYGSAAAVASGPLSEDEAEALRAAYAAGARGSVLIGLRQVVRILTVLLPEPASEAAGAGQMARAGGRLRRLGCDGYIHARRVRLRFGGPRAGGGGAVAAAALLIDQRLCSGQEPPVDTGPAAIGDPAGTDTNQEPGEEQRVLLLARGASSPFAETWRLRGAARLRDAVSEALDQALDRALRGG